MVVYEDFHRIERLYNFTNFVNAVERVEVETKNNLCAFAHFAGTIGVAVENNDVLNAGHPKKCIGVFRWQNDMHRVALAEQVLVKS